MSQCDAGFAFHSAFIILNSAFLFNDFIFPVINGFIDIKEEKENYDEEFKFILIGRKDTRRSGVRLLIRGADSEGNVSNSCESEEIVIYKPSNKEEINLASFVQVRGSIPLMWTQEPSLQLNPQIRPRNDFDVNATVKRGVSKKKVTYTPFINLGVAVSSVKIIEFLEENGIQYNSI